MQRARRRSVQLVMGSSPAPNDPDVAAMMMEDADSEDEQTSVAQDLAAVMAHPKRESVLKGDALHVSARVQKVSKGSKLQRRVLALTDSCMCDVQPNSMKCVHRVEYNKVVGYSVNPGDDSGVIIYLDQRCDFLLIFDYLATVL